MAIMQVERGQYSAALETAEKIAGSLAGEESGERLSQEVERTRSSGGAAAADFTDLIELITETIEPDSWEDAGGTGTIKEFPLGVYVDAEGVLRRRLSRDSKEASALERLRGHLQTDAPEAPASAAYVVSDTRPAGSAEGGQATSELRMISLPRVEEAARYFQEAGLPLPDEIRYLGGLASVRYVFAFPERNDLVIAGTPAWSSESGTDIGDSRGGSQARFGAGQPMLQLDDFVVLLRSCMEGPGKSFGCTIEPQPEALKRVNDYRLASGKASLSPATRERWVKKLRENLGLQDVRIWGVPADSRVGLIMLEADYRMKLVGIGLEKGPAGISSYLDLLESHARGAPPPLETLRWWFTPRYDAILASADGLAYELRGEAVQVLSENQFLLASGQRVLTGQAEPVNELFARNFTQHYPELARQESDFAELRNVFDLSVVAALVTKYKLADKVGWKPTFFGSAEGYRVAQWPVPQRVESVVNYKVFNGRHVVTAVSGGVLLDPWKALASPQRQNDSSGTLGRAQHRAATSASDGDWRW